MPAAPTGSPSVVLDLHGDLRDLVRDPAAVVVPVPGPRSVKDALESVGIPHTEIGGIAVDGVAVGWSARLVGGERVQALPVSAVPPGWPRPLVSVPATRPPRFVADVHLGTLARRLRLLGFDTWWGNDADDPELAARSVHEDRVLLTRDRGLLMRRVVRLGALVRAEDPDRQVRDVVTRFALGELLAPRTRCVACNGGLAPVDPAMVAAELPPGTRAMDPERVSRCDGCDRLYWPGAHDDDLAALVAAARDGPV